MDSIVESKSWPSSRSWLSALSNLTYHVILCMSENEDVMFWQAAQSAELTINLLCTSTAKLSFGRMIIFKAWLRHIKIKLSFICLFELLLNVSGSKKFNWPWFMLIGYHISLLCHDIIYVCWLCFSWPLSFGVPVLPCFHKRLNSILHQEDTKIGRTT